MILERDYDSDYNSSRKVMYISSLNCAAWPAVVFDYLLLKRFDRYRYRCLQKSYEYELKNQVLNKLRQHPIEK